MGKNTSEKAQETAQKKPKGLEKLKKFKKSITELFTGPNNEEAWNKFPEETKKEMLESLNMKDKIQRSTDDILKLSETDTLSGICERLVFKEGIVKKDKIGNYIEIDGNVESGNLVSLGLLTKTSERDITQIND